MTDIIHRIPTEIWINVFQHLYTPDLCQCRLVCQIWNHPAEEAIFRDGVYMNSEDSAKKLYQLLLEKPHLARLIKEIDLDVVCQSPDTVPRLVRASFTSNMECVSVWPPNANSQLLATLIDAAKSSPDSRFKLKYIPSSEDTNIYDEYHIAAAHTFRESLEYLEISLNCREMNSLLNSLEGFKSLKRLSLDITPLESVERLDTVLRNCHGLRKLQLTSPSISNNDDNYMEQDEIDIARWVVQHVEQVKTMEKVEAVKPYLDMVHYLIYKYPHMKSLKCSGLGLYDEGFSLGLLDASKHLPEFSTRFYYHQHQELQQSISSIYALHDMPHNISVHIFPRIQEADNNGNHGMAMSVRMSRGGAETLYLGIALDHQLTQTVPIGVMEQLANTLDGRYTISELTVDAVFNLSWRLVGGDAPFTFYYILDHFPALKRLDLSIQKIQHEPIITNTQLKDLTIEFTELDAQVLPEISQHFTSLQRLNISGCSILDEQQHGQDSILHINVPYSSLAFLHVGIENNWMNATDHYLRMLDKFCNPLVCYLQLTILDVNMTLYCRLEGWWTIVQLSQEDFEARPNKENTVVIMVTCASIGLLHLQVLRMLRPQINVKEFVLRKLQLDIEQLRAKITTLSSQEEVVAAAASMELVDKEQKYNSYLAQSKSFDQQLENISWPYATFSADETRIKDIPSNNTQ